MLTASAASVSRSPPSALPTVLGGPRYERRRPEETALWQTIRETWPEFEAALRDEEAGHQLPAFVQREFISYLDCGLLCRGFAHVKCTGCSERKLVAFCCKKRGFCPSCVGRRMCERAVLLTEEVLPPVPLRQWVLTLPYPVRYRLAFDGKTLAAVLRLFVDTVLGHYRRTARAGGHPDGEGGGVTALQRASSDLRLNPHFHSLFLDGVFVADADTYGKPVFHAAPTLRQEDVEAVLTRARERILRYLERRGIIAAVAAGGDGEVAAYADDPLADKDPVLAPLLASAVAGKPPAGPGHKLAPVILAPREGALANLRSTGRLSADLGGFSLHAATHVHANDQRGREALCRYILRPPLANDRLLRLPNGRVRILFKKPFRDGTTAVDLEPRALVARLAAIVPTPRLHITRYHGVLAPRGRWRSQIVPRPVPDVTAEVPGAGDDGQPSSQPSPKVMPPPTTFTPAPSPDAPPKRRRYIPWAELLRRTFAMDVLHCDRCGGRMKLLALVKDPISAQRFLAGLGLPTGPPPPTVPVPKAQPTGLQLAFDDPA